jgi:hypothetical protein
VACAVAAAAAVLQVLFLRGDLPWLPQRGLREDVVVGLYAFDVSCNSWLWYPDTVVVLARSSSSGSSDHAW